MPSFYATASEAATMDFARNILKMPVPRVLAWSAHADSAFHGVGSEFLLMEQTPGVNLDSRWYNLRSDDWISLIQETVQLTNRFTSHHFSQIGSIFYKEDVDPSLRNRPLYADGDVHNEASDRFRIGPLVDWETWRGSRMSLCDADRGPCSRSPPFLLRYAHLATIGTDEGSYLCAVIRNEQRWLQTVARLPPMGSPFRRIFEAEPVDEVVSLLDQLLDMIYFGRLVPEIITPVLWHPRLDGENIMITEESPPKITGLLGWRGAAVRPLFLNACYAEFCVYDGDAIKIERGVLEVPQLPAGFDSLEPAEKAAVRRERDLALRQKYYEAQMKKTSPDQWSALTFPFTPSLVRGIHSALQTRYTGTFRLRKSILELRSIWHELFPECTIYLPKVSYSEDYLEEMGRKLEQHVWHTLGRNEITKRLGVRRGSEGWVPIERFEEAKRINKSQRELWDDTFAGVPYPFQDGAPSYLLD